MKAEKDYVESFIKEELEKEAENARRENTAEGPQVMSEDIKERIWQNLQKETEEYDFRLRYPELSDEDREALRVGQKVLENEKEKKNKPGRRRGFRFYAGFAAVLVMALAIGIVSFGEADRIVRFVKGIVGEREVVQVDSSEDNLIIVEENEEEAYAIVEEEFGIKPVQLIGGALEGMSFESMEFDTALQLAELYYIYCDKRIVFFVSASYVDSSWGVDVEDELTGEYQLEKNGCVIKEKEYKVAKTQSSRCSAIFSYKGLEYFLVGEAERGDFELILQNLYFL